MTAHNRKTQAKRRINKQKRAQLQERQARELAQAQIKAYNAHKTAPFTYITGAIILLGLCLSISPVTALAAFIVSIVGFICASINVVIGQKERRKDASVRRPGRYKWMWALFAVSMFAVVVTAISVHW
ncbi:hypothetical protein [Bifidobacterium magnum]|uniref:Uncharacterized protein n=1 Tax=Bifidobacterium magnum TaxID=1692 RepID=A0A087BEQ3_9BIFI|nr:hypothetical protein [Bifidobacterium magnum]KFI69503.1 hypothetical protein BMAGN_1214 [Bifidobacterium magnum]